MRLIRRQLLNIIAVEEQPETHTFNVISDDEYLGKFFYCVAQYDGEQVFGTWSITSGGSYATVNQNGRVDIVSGTTNKSITIQCTYVVDNETLTATKTITVSYDNQLTIECASTLEGISGNAIARYNNEVVTPTWSIVEGSSHATIDSTGAITIRESGTITIRADYRDYRALRTVSVVYVSGQSTSTEVGDDGSVTVTTTETTTNLDGSTTETSTSTTTHEDGSVSTTEEETTNNLDGSSTTTSTTVNQDGTSSQSQTDVASDGSSASTTTNYNENGDPTSGSNNTTDVSGNSNTQEITYDENGDVTVTAYTIDTTGNQAGTGETISGDGINTEFLPWDNSDGWEMRIRFRTVKTEQPNPPLVTDTEDTGANYHFTIVCAKSPFKPWPGFHIRWTLQKNNYSKGNLVLGYTQANSNNSTNKSLALAPTTGANANLYDFTVAYDPTLKKYPSKFRCIDNFGRAATISYNYDFDPIDYEFTIGYNINQKGNPYRYSNLTVYEFTINKL